MSANMQGGPLLLSPGHESYKKAFHQQTKSLVLSPCCCLFCLAFEATCLLIEFIIPDLESARKTSSHNSQGSLPLTTASSRPPHTLPTPCPGQAAILLTPVTEILEPAVLLSLPVVVRGDRAWWITEKPRSIVVLNKVHTVALLFCF